jgi:hypothetical protein
MGRFNCIIEKKQQITPHSQKIHIKTREIMWLELANFVGSLLFALNTVTPVTCLNQTSFGRNEIHLH